MRKFSSMCLFIISILVCLFMTTSFMLPVVIENETDAKMISEVTEIQISDVEEIMVEKKITLQDNYINNKVNDEDEVKDDVVEKNYTDDDLDLLARLIQAEAGYSDCSDTFQREVGSVVLNRIKDVRFPDTLKGVVYDTKYAVQYGCTTNGMIDNKPSQRAIDNAKYILTYGSVVPEDVLTQSEYIQGDIWKQYTYHGTTIYFCFAD